MREFFEFLTIFDWITPSFGFVEDFINDPTLLRSNSWTFFIPYDQAVNTGWNADAIESLMEQHGIHHWGGQYTYPNNEFFFSVKLEQAQWAEYLLLRFGVPIKEKYLGAPRPKRKSGWSSSHQRKNSGGGLMAFLDDLFG